jgi:hypothetical protein
MENEINGCHYDGPERKVVKWEVATTESTLCPAVGYGISGVKPSGFSAIVSMLEDRGQFQDANFPNASIGVLLARIRIYSNPYYCLLLKCRYLFKPTKHHGTIFQKIV